jgi:hypothetical protein
MLLTRMIGRFSSTARLPGFALAKPTSCLRLCVGIEGCTATAVGTTVMTANGREILERVVGQVCHSDGVDHVRSRIGDEQHKAVGFERATSELPIAPLAAALLSTMTFWPSTRVISCAYLRRMMSFTPPAQTGRRAGSADREPLTCGAQRHQGQGHQPWRTRAAPHLVLVHR